MRVVISTIRKDEYIFKTWMKEAENIDEILIVQREQIFIFVEEKVDLFEELELPHSSEVHEENPSVGAVRGYKRKLDTILVVIPALIAPYLSLLSDTDHLFRAKPIELLPNVAQTRHD